MNEAASPTIEQFSPDDPWPDAVEKLVGHERVPADHPAQVRPYALLGAIEQGQWKAALLLWIEQSDDEKLASIRQMAVHPDARGAGLGGRLIRHAIKLAEKEGCQRIRSTAGWGCPDHARLYERMKFQPLTGQTPYLVEKSFYSN